MIESPYLNLSKARLPEVEDPSGLVNRGTADSGKITEITIRRYKSFIKKNQAIEISYGSSNQDNVWTTRKCLLILKICSCPSAKYKKDIWHTQSKLSDCYTGQLYIPWHNRLAFCKNVSLESSTSKSVIPNNHDRKGGYPHSLA